MKKLFPILYMLIAVLISSSGSYAQPPHVDGGGIFTIDRYLARSLSMYNLAGLRQTNAGAFNAEVNSILALRPTFLRRVANAYGSETGMVPGAAYHTAAQQAVAEINMAFDIAGIPRPIVQAGFYEYITSDVDGIQIPNYVLQDFAAFDPDFPNTPFATPGPHYFYKSNIAYSGTPGGVFDPPNTPDITKISARMWFYYVATQFIIMGYQGLHAGWIDQYTKNDQSTTLSNNFIKTAQLFRMIRNYATTQGTWVVIDAHSYDLYEGTTNNLVLDFNSAPFRFDEILHPMPGTPCVNESFNGDLNPFEFHYNWLTSEGGVPPMAVAQGTGYVYDRTPMMFEWDWVFTSPSGQGIANHSGMPWGFDETSWVHNIITDQACRSYIITNAACATKNDLYYRSYFQMPGRIISLHPSGGTELNLINANPILRQEILDKTWNPNDNLHFTIMPHCEEKCKGDGGPVNTRTYICRITNPDCSSVYQWHVQKPDGTWLPITYGNYRKLENLSPGTHTIYATQNNLGMNDPVIQVMRQLDARESPAGSCSLIETPAGMAKPGKDNSSGEVVDTRLYSQSAPVSIKNQLLSEGDASSKRNFKVSPNPAQNTITAKFDINETAEVTVYVIDAMGQKKMALIENKPLKAGTHAYTGELNNLPAGVYYMIMKSDKETRSEMFTIIR